VRALKQLIGIICSIGYIVNVQFVDAAPNDNLQDSRLQAQDRQNRLEESRIRVDADLPLRVWWYLNFDKVYVSWAVCNG
jgi:hypothetical protein